tara:strand:+ start:368 stop:1486 length:1119 start_codon:yes stop_codon:yes gene_type:complete
MIFIKEATSKKDIKTFVKFPFSIHKNSKYWVPPIISEEVNVFDKKKNPVLADSDVRLFLAYKNEVLVGRIAAIINWIEVNEQGLRKIRFGWMDMINDLEVTKALLSKVNSIGISQKMDYMEGPMGFSNLDKVGVLTYGYEEIGKMITWYNPPYYVDHFKKLNFKVEKEYVEHKFKVKDILFETHERLQGLIKKRYNLRALSFNKTKDVLVYADRMFDLFNDSFASLSSFVKIPDIQKDHLKKKFLSFINPEYIKFVINGSNELVAFSVIMPSYSTAFQKINGNIFPFGLYHIFKAKKSKTVDLYLIGVRPEYQKKGVHAIIFNEFQKTFEKHKISECRMTPVLADNVAMRNMWTDYKLKLTKKRCTFRKELK